MSTLLPSGALTTGAEPMSSGCNDRKGRGNMLSNTDGIRSKPTFPSKAHRRAKRQSETTGGRLSKGGKAGLEGDESGAEKLSFRRAH